MSATAERLSVRALLRGFVRGTDLDDPYEIALAFADEHGDALNLYDVLDELVPIVVRSEFALLRSGAIKAASVDGRGGGGPGRTKPNRDQIRRRNNDILKTWRVSVVGKRLLECTAADLRSAARKHEQRSANESHRAEQYLGLAALAESEGARTLSDVKPDRILEVLEIA